MPIREYGCAECGHWEDRIESLTGEEYKDYPPCPNGHGTMNRNLTSAVPFFVGEFSGGTKPAFKPTDRSPQENLQEAKVQKRNREDKAEQSAEKHVTACAEQWTDFS